jgi:hypothetical protein
MTKCRVSQFIEKISVQNLKNLGKTELMHFFIERQGLERQMTPHQLSEWTYSPDSDLNIALPIE